MAGGRPEPHILPGRGQAFGRSGCAWNNTCPLLVQPWHPPVCRGMPDPGFRRRRVAAELVPLAAFIYFVLYVVHTDVVFFWILFFLPHKKNKQVPLPPPFQSPVGNPQQVLHVLGVFCSHSGHCRMARKSPQNCAALAAPQVLRPPCKVDLTGPANQKKKRPCLHLQSTEGQLSHRIFFDLTVLAQQLQPGKKKLHPSHFAIVRLCLTRQHSSHSTCPNFFYYTSVGVNNMSAFVTSHTC